jgi:very-short-patch-repair endonuclease
MPDEDKRITTRDQIIEILKNQPGLKSRQIADLINSDRALVNSVLYAELRNIAIQDSQYQWHIKDASNSKEQRNKARSNTKLADLCDYYLSCLNLDDTNGLSVFAANKYGNLDYAELPELPLISDNPSSTLESDDARTLFRKTQRERSRLIPVLGYPVRLTKVRGRSGWEGFFVEPIFLYGFSEDVSDRNVSTLLENEPPQINPKAIRSLTFAEGSNITEEIIQLSKELGLSDASNELPEADEIILRLRSVRPEWDWKEDIDPYHTALSPSLSQISEPGIYNRAVLFIAERSPYTRGLETELGMLREVDEHTYKGTALGDWLSGQALESQPPAIEPLLEILPLNSEQRQAVTQGLNNRLTVITGPPGTGKSQVVISLLINAAWQGKSVLFASKNNKAVDVVEARTNSLGSRPILLRLGSNDYQVKLAEYLLSLFTASASKEDDIHYQELLKTHVEITDRFKALDQEINNTIKLRNEVDQLEQAIEPLRTNIEATLFQSLGSPQVGVALSAINQLLSSIWRAIYSEQPVLTRLFWGYVKKKRYAEAQDAVNKSRTAILDSIGVSLPLSEISDISIEEYRNAVNTINQRLGISRQIQQYYARLKSLSETKALEAISKEYFKLVTKLTETSISLWQAWLKLQPARMTQEERGNLREYSSLLQMIASVDDSQRLNSQVFRRFQSLFPKIMGVLSCWAVTSLSTRGRIPFEPAYFDLLVIDEASQCDIASALPLLYRAKRVVVIGDPKQLRHISSLPPRQDSQLIAKHGLAEGYSSWAYSVNSLWDLSSGLCRNNDIVYLRDHHRSHADIIEFSNHQFYDDKLRVATDYSRLKLLNDGKPVVRWLDVSGKVVRPPSGSAVNENEARAVAHEVERLVLKQGYTGSIGAVTPFRAQAMRIKELISENDILSDRLAKMDFLPYTIDGFQGDERDIMIFSPVISSGISTGALGFLKSRPNLFNVAITRARAALIVVGDEQAALNSGIEHLTKFAQYVKQLGSEVNGDTETEIHLGAEYPVVAHPELVSDWEKVLYSKLFVAGLRPIPQYEVEKYILDFALFMGKRKLNIEVDGEHYHKNWDGELSRRDQIRNQRLIELGWDVMRFWVYQVRDDLPNCIKRIKEWAK